MNSNRKSNNNNNSKGNSNINSNNDDTGVNLTAFVRLHAPFKGVVQSHLNI